MLVIGLGKGGCNVAKLFKKHKNYQVVVMREKGYQKETVEEYDDFVYKPPKTWLTKPLKPCNPFRVW